MTNITPMPRRINDTGRPFFASIVIRKDIDERQARAEIESKNQLVFI